MAMTSAETAAWAQALAGALTFGAACFAAWFTRTAPRRAAELAESLRLKNDSAEMHCREKRTVLLVMMQERGRLRSEDAQKAVNSIPVVFAGDDRVLAAYRRFCSLEGPYTPETLRIFLLLIGEVIRSAGFADVITPAEVDIGYYVVTTPPPQGMPDNLKMVLDNEDKMIGSIDKIANAAEYIAHNLPRVEG